MSAKSKSRKPPSAAPTPEAHLAELLTICWMLAVMTTLLCEVGSLATMGIAATYPDQRWAAILSGMLLFAALVVGLGSIAMMPLVWRKRKEPPPRPIAIMAVAVGVIPLLIALARAVSVS